MVGFGPTTTASEAHQFQISPTKKAYFDDMYAVQASANFRKFLTDGDRIALILDCSIFYPQGGGQPCDTGFIYGLDGEVKFRVEDVRLKNDIVYHYGVLESSKSFSEGQEVSLFVDAARRAYNSRLHSAGHLLDACLKSIGLASLEPRKGYHFPDGPFVEYKGIIASGDLERIKSALEAEANRLVSAGGSVTVVTVPYEEACKLCGGSLPDYIPQDSTPRIVTIGDLGGPCGGTHVADVAKIGNVKVLQIRVKKGFTKVSYSIAP